VVKPNQKSARVPRLFCPQETGDWAQLKVPKLEPHWSITSFVTSFVTRKAFVMSYELRNELRNEGRKLVMLYEALVTRLAWCYKASSL
jgi:hypothetical protein